MDHAANQTTFPQVEPRLSPQVKSVLRRLRRRIRRYVVLEAVAVLVAVMGLMFWISLGLDWAWFQFSKVELPSGFRAACRVLALILVPVLALWLLSPVLRIMRAKALALVLEKRFPELNDRLITAVETVEDRALFQTPLTATMLQKTVDDVSRLADRLQVREVFNRGPLRRNLMAAATAVISVGVLYGMNREAVARWQDAYVEVKGQYWDRDTRLLVQVIAQPGERVRNFKDSQGRPTNGHPGVYKHPRGEDLTLLITVPEHGPQGTSWKVPDQVELQYHVAGEFGRRRGVCTKVGDRQFRFSRAKQLDSLEFDVIGGDFRNRQPYRIQVVDPPRLDSIHLACDYPDYTGLDLRDPQGEPIPEERAVHGSQISLPMETQFVLHASANKPLVEVRLRIDAYEVMLTGDKATLTLLTEDDGPQREVALSNGSGRRWLAEDGSSFRVPFHLTEGAVDKVTRQPGSVPIPLPADVPLRISVEDADEILSSEPVRLTVNGLADQPPVVETALRGIGESITRRAMIPVEGTIRDDYGLETALFEFRLGDESSWRQRPFRHPPQASPQEFQLQRDENQPFERFEVLPLDLSVGQRLTLTVYARDGDNLNGPHVGRGERHVFEIVSPEELLSILYSKELNLRLRFEQIIAEVEQTEQDLTLHRARAEEAEELRRQLVQLADGSPDAQVLQQNLQEAETAVSVAAERALHQVRKNAGETAAVEEAFREILQELINNGVHTREAVSGMEDLIVQPLHTINTVDFPAADEAVGLFKLANEKGTDPVPHIEESLTAIRTMLAHMKQVLGEMKDLVEFHEILRDLKSIIQEEAELAEETKKERNKELLDRIKGTSPE